MSGEQEIVYLPATEETIYLIGYVKLHGTIEQIAQLQPKEAYAFPMNAPEYMVDQWQAAMDRLSDLVMEIAR